MWSIWVADRTLPYVEGPCKERRSVLNAKRTIWNKRHLCQSGANICRENVDDPPGQAERDEGRGRLWASRHRHCGRLPEHGRAARIRVRGPSMGPRPRIPELSGTPGLDPEEERWARQQRVPPHSLDRHAEDDERIEEGPRDPGDHRHDRRRGHRGPHQRGPPREPPRVRRDEGPGHARRALDRDAPGVLEVLEQCFMDGPNPVRPFFRSRVVSDSPHQTSWWATLRSRSKARRRTRASNPSRTRSRATDSTFRASSASSLTSWTRATTTNGSR